MSNTQTHTHTYTHIHAQKMAIRQQCRLPNRLNQNVCQLVTSLLLIIIVLMQVLQCPQTVRAGPMLMRVCDTREVKTVTSRVCMLYKRTKNSDVKLDKQGNLRITRSSSSSSKNDYSPAKLASDCCKIGCPPHIFASIC